MHNPIPHSQPTISEEDLLIAREVMLSNHLEDGIYVRDLEDAFSNFTGHRYAAGVTNGFAAIHLALIALGVGEGDEVILPSYTCAALLNPILILRAKPVVLDIAPNSFNLDPSRVREAINANSKAIIVPHIFGFPARVDELVALGVPVIEDCAQALGGTYKGQPFGSFGAISIFSFYASKMITGGDGGMITTSNSEWAKVIENYRYYGHKKLHRYPAYNYHLTNIPAAIAGAQFKRLDSFVQRRKQIASFYRDALSEHYAFDVENTADSVFYRFLINSDQRDALKEHLYEAGIYAGFGVLEGMHQMLELTDSDFPNTTHQLNTVLSLPIYPGLLDEQAQRVADTILNFSH